MESADGQASSRSREEGRPFPGDHLRRACAQRAPLGPAGSRIDSVAFYTEDDRPILEQVYAEIADLIDDFEGGGQLRMSA